MEIIPFGGEVEPILILEQEAVPLRLDLVDVAFDWPSIAPSQIHYETVFSPSSNLCLTECAKLVCLMLIEQASWEKVSSTSHGRAQGRELRGMKTSVKSGRYVRSHSQIVEFLRFFPHLSHFTPTSSHYKQRSAVVRSFAESTAEPHLVLRECAIPTTSYDTHVGSVGSSLSTSKFRWWPDWIVRRRPVNRIIAVVTLVR